MVMLFSLSASSIFDWSTLLQALVVDDLDPLALLHVVDDHLADDAVREAVVLDPDRQVVEEGRRPQPLEVLANRLLDCLVVGNPLARDRRPKLDVVQVGVGLDHRIAALLLEAEDDPEDHRSGTGRREVRGGRDRLTADGDGSLSRLRDGRGGGRGRCSGRRGLGLEADRRGQRRDKER